MIVYLVLLAICLYFIFVNSRLHFAKRRLTKQMGGPKGYPLIGNALDFINNMDRTLLTLLNYVNKYGDRLAFSFGPYPNILVANAEDMEKVCASTELIAKSPEYDLVYNFLGEGLITSKGSLWQHRRKLLTPCFHFTILERFIGPINTHAGILVDILEKKFFRSGEFKNISHYIARCALDIICETSMGIQMNSQQTSDSAYVNAINKYGEIFQYRSIRPWLMSNFIWNLTSKGKEEAEILKVIHGFTAKVIADRKKSKENTQENINHQEPEEEDGGTKVKKPFLDMLLEAQKNDSVSISDDGIREETTTFIFAGHDTVSVAVSFCLYNLGNNLEAQAKLHEELDSIFGDDKTRNVSSTDLRNLKYLELCIKETLRLFPSVPIIGRHAYKPFKLDENTIIPAGVTVYMFPYKLHRNKKYFKKPNEFIPERFDQENKEFAEERKMRSAFAYAPFSAGPRNCIGQKLAMMEAKIVLATVLRRFRIRAEKPSEEIELLSEIILRVKGGLNVKLEAR